MRIKIQAWINKIKKYRFIFEQLVNRDFKQKYKGTVLGMVWSVLSPLLTLLVLKLIFTEFFGRNTLYYTTYMFAGNVFFSYFKESTTGGMSALMGNAHIFSKIKVPKYLFLLSKDVSSVINFGLTLILFFIFAAIDHVPFHWRFFAIIYPICTLTLFNIGFSMILSALFVFFRDIRYIYDIFTRLLFYMSAIFYYVDKYPADMQKLFLLNPVYCNILYVRSIILNGKIPSFGFHMLLLFYSLLVLFIGVLIYKKNNQKFLYYV